MGAVSNVTQTSNTYAVNKVLSRLEAPAFAKVPVMISLIATEDLPEGQHTLTKSFKQKGSMTASATLAQATAGSIGSPRADTSVDATAAKAVRVDGIAVEVTRFTSATLADYATDQGAALGRIVDDQILALFTSVTNQVDVGGVLTVDDLDEAQTLILASAVPSPNKQLKFVGGTRAVRNLKQDIRDSGGAAIANERFLSIFNGPPAINGYFGSLPGYDLYYTPSGLTDVSSQNAQCLFHPDYAFAGMFDRSITVWTTQKGSEGFYTEIASHYFWAAILWNDGAAVEVLSAG